MQICPLLLNLCGVGSLFGIGSRCIPESFWKKPRSPGRGTVHSWSKSILTSFFFLGYITNLRGSFNSHCRLDMCNRQCTSLGFPTSFLLLSSFSWLLCYPLPLNQVGCLGTILEPVFYFISHSTKSPHPVGFLKTHFNWHIIHIVHFVHSRGTIHWFLG